MSKDEVERAKKALTAPKRVYEPPTTPDMLLGTGSTLLNLALSGKVKGGIKKGYVVLFIGKPKSGKSWLSFNALAEAANSKDFSDYRLIFDNVENGAHMDLRKHFGERLFDKLGPPGGTWDDPVYSTTAEEFYYNVDDALNDGRKFVYVLDSMDGLTTEEEQEKFAKDKNANRAGKEKSGTYGMGKAKVNSQNLRVVSNRLMKSGSIVIIICQTRDNVGFGAQFNPDTYAGGNSLGFYARQVVWTKTVERIRKSVRSHQVDVGGLTQAKVTKSSINGWEGKVEFPITRFAGIDDVASMVAYLVEWKHWKENSGKIDARDFGVTLGENALVKHVKDNDLEKDLRAIVQDVWDAVEEEVGGGEKRRYV